VLALAFPFETVFAGLQDEMPIRYWKRTPRDFTREWEQAAREGRLDLDASSERAFLESVLDKLGISPASQMLVFSTTSFQVDKITPSHPRALYFNEDHYVGWVPGGDLEVTTVGPRTGLNFYQMPVAAPSPNRPVFQRNDACLSCHGASEETPFPRTIVLSVFANEDGNQVMRGKTFAVDHRTPIEKRWGGWYVTGSVSGPRHRGNLFAAPDPNLPEAVDTAAGDRDLGAHRPDLAGIVDLTAYPAATSDILALLVFEHQALAHNQISRAFGLSRIALWNDEGFLSNRSLSDETLAVLEAEAEALLEVFLFQDEAPLGDHRFVGDSGYRADFLARARRDDEGRSLRDLDLEDRLFRHRFSYMIHSAAFEHLPDPFKKVFFGKLATILDGDNPDYDYLPAPERTAIREILSTTLPDFPLNDS